MLWLILNSYSCIIDNWAGWWSWITASTSSSGWTLSCSSSSCAGLESELDPEAFLFSLGRVARVSPRESGEQRQQIHTSSSISRAHHQWMNLTIRVCDANKLNDRWWFFSFRTRGCLDRAERVRGYVISMYFSEAPPRLCQQRSFRTNIHCQVCSEIYKMIHFCTASNSNNSAEICKTNLANVAFSKCCFL